MWNRYPYKCIECHLLDYVWSIAIESAMYCLHISWIHIPEHDTVFIIGIAHLFWANISLFLRIWVCICLFFFLILTDATLVHYFCDKIDLNKTQMSDTRGESVTTKEDG